MGEQIWVPYAVDNHGITGPVVNVVLTGPNGKPFPTRAKVDSGASKSTFPMSFVAELGIDLVQCKEGRANTPVGPRDVLEPISEEVDVHIREVDRAFKTHPLFFPKGNSVLLGRDDAFELLRVTFDHRAWGMYLEPYE